MDTLYEQLCLDHHNLNQLLTALESLLEDLACTEREPATLGLILEAIDYISVYPDKCHYPIEERVMARLRTKPGCDLSLLDKIHRDHNALADATRKMSTLFYAVANDCAVERQNLLNTARVYLGIQRQHIQLENRNLFPIIDNLLTHDDREKIRANIDNLTDPLFEQKNRVQYDALHEYVVESAGSERATVYTQILANGKGKGQDKRV